MVQGNSARRKELAQGRRQDRKKEIARKKAGARCATPIEARARLLHFANMNGATDDELRAWVSVECSSEKDVCDAFWRTGSCSRKRCRYDHSESIAFLTGVPESSVAEVEVVGAVKENGEEKKAEEQEDEMAVRGRKKRGGGGKRRSKKHSSASSSSNSSKQSGNGCDCLPAMVCKPLSSVQAGGHLAYDTNLRTQRRTKSTLQFVEFRGALVFDAYCPGVFASFAAAATSATKAAAAQKVECSKGHVKGKAEMAEVAEEAEEVAEEEVAEEAAEEVAEKAAEEVAEKAEEVAEEVAEQSSAKCRSEVKER